MRMAMEEMRQARHDADDIEEGLTAASVEDDLRLCLLVASRPCPAASLAGRVLDGPLPHFLSGSRRWAQ